MNPCSTFQEPCTSEDINALYTVPKTMDVDRSASCPTRSTSLSEPEPERTPHAEKVHARMSHLTRQPSLVSDSEPEPEDDRQCRRSQAATGEKAASDKHWSLVFFVLAGLSWSVRKDWFGSRSREQTVVSQLDEDVDMSAPAPNNRLASLPLDNGAQFLQGDSDLDSTSVEGDMTADFARKLISVKLTRQQVTETSAAGAPTVKSVHYATVNVGSTGKAFRVIFDTGSGHFILPSRYCHTETCRRHRRYARSQSTTAQDLDVDGAAITPDSSRGQLTVNFGTGSVSGVFVEDLVCMDPSALSAWTSKQKSKLHDVSSEFVKGFAPVGCVRMRFIAATSMTADPFNNFDFDGVVGLGLQGISYTSNFNFFTMLSQSMHGWGTVLPNIFSIFLASETNQNEASEITFGGYAEKHFQGELAWNDVYKPELGHWLIGIKSIHVGDELVNYCVDGNCRAALDTGTSLLGVPTSGFGELYRRLWHNAPLNGDCNDSGGPVLQIELASGFVVELGPEDYSMAQTYTEAQIRRSKALPALWGVPHPSTTSHFSGTSRVDLQCKPMLMSMDLPEPLGPKLFILGEPTLRKYFTVYNAKSHRVGFARATHSHSAEASSSQSLSDDWFFADDDDE